MINFGNAFGWLTTVCAGIITAVGWIRDWLAYAWKWLAEHALVLLLAPVMLIAWVAKWLWEKIMYAINFRDTIESWFGSMANVKDIALTTWSWAEKLNYVLPLDVIVWACIVLIIWRVIIALYHFIKSWIPTVSGG